MLALGLDIGGANLKAASSAGDAKTTAFEIWRAPHELPLRLRELIGGFPPVDVLAVTMTAELADCFATKAEGVAAIVAAVSDVAGPTPVLVWQTSGNFARPEVAAARPALVSAANWHALATWAGRLAPQGSALLFDLGSTTADIVPLDNGRPVARGTTDLERLRNHELVYTGFRRTPLCAVASHVPLRGRPCPVAAELFATTLDVYLLLGLIPEDAADTNTADGRPATIACALDRLGAHGVLRSGGDRPCRSPRDRPSFRFRAAEAAFGCDHTGCLARCGRARDSDYRRLRRTSGRENSR